ncbi:MAG: molybdate ABC transporter substrate-binding protein [Anaerolineales bacterium]|nr:molybdate ABC transporter substrate-binding protein [Anaerolineales bacterium]MCW5855917.1 molybdate ABC transporter substrate-binding protein [Anaerolineales bacterium]
MKRFDKLHAIVLGLMVLSAVLAACAPAASGEVTVFAASSLTDAFTEIGAAFEAQHAGSQVLFNFGGSSQLATQLAEGAPADVFASANQAQMANAAAAGRISGEPVLFLTNRLVIVVPADNPAGIQTPADLAKANLRLVLAAPDVPIREYSDQAITALGDAAYQQAVYANLVSEEPNVRQVATKVALGEADAGIIYTSDVTPDIAGQVLQIEIPVEANVIAVYPIAAVEGGQPALAQQFIDFVLSPDGQAILAKWGFGPRP